MRAKDYLLQIRKLDRLINNKLLEFDQWMSIATSTTVSTEGERVQSSGSKDKMGDAVARLVDVQTEINREIDRLVDLKREVIRDIEQLPIADEYDILHMIYVQGMTFQEAADALNKSYRWTTALHGRALSHLQKILNERNEDVRSKL